MNTSVELQKMVTTYQMVVLLMDAAKITVSVSWVLLFHVTAGKVEFTTRRPTNVLCLMSWRLAEEPHLFS